VTRTADHWWQWAEEDDARMYLHTQSLDRRCRLWVAVGGDDGPDLAWLAEADRVADLDAEDDARERAIDDEGGW